MTPPKLVSHALCPYVQRAAITLSEKSLPFEREVIDLEHRPAWFTAISPAGKVPLLIVDGRDVLFESAAICEYLDETNEPPLHPENAVERAQHRAWIEYSSGTLAEIGGLYSAKDEGAFSGKLEALANRFRRLEFEMTAGPYFSGARFSLVDAAFAPVFRYFDVFDTFMTTGVLADAESHSMASRA